MNDDRALREVWQWKEEIYKETKGMSIKDFVKFARKRARAFRKKLPGRGRTGQAGSGWASSRMKLGMSSTTA